MNTQLRIGKSYRSQLLYVLLVPAFFLIFSFLYNPFGMKEYYQIGGMGFGFHFLMLACILLAVLAITRLVFSAIYKHTSFLWWHYVIWCFGEVFVYSLFMALYTTLFRGGGSSYFSVLSTCFKFAYLILVFPYLFFCLLQIIHNKDVDLNAEPTETLVKFYDEHKRLKLTIDPSAIICIQADANYVIIRYMDAERIKEFILRASMKSVENTVSQHGLVRCHRSYFVNPKYVKLLSKSKEGMISAELLHPEVPSIPVSKHFYKQLSELL
ncbi:MAG: LytTR family transcriptional regulator [Bacteroidales bacterium]|nr:LytTR family transcriptional regulator [Bacteroidales bacterium]